ncbi:MAG: response regulator [Bacteroidetes bacterium]|nr:response regulator [Bacteroidota bacterium]MDA1268768.1 response regulator [Bacteroidota bacterium]
MKSKNILIIENKEQDRKLMEYLIGQIHSFQSFTQGNDALSQLANYDPYLILISLQLIDIEPILFLQKVRAEVGYSCLLVGLSSTTDQTQTSYFREQGFDEVISKPIRPKELILKIQNLVERQRETGSNDLKKSDSLQILNPEVYQQLLRLSSKEVILQVFFDFVVECKNLVQLLETNRKNEIAVEILRTIHTLKGNSGTLGAEKLYAAAKCSESLGKQQKSIEFAESLHYLKATLQEFQEFLKKEPSLYHA